MPPRCTPARERRVCVVVFVSLHAHLGLAPLRMSSALHTLPSDVVCLNEYLRCQRTRHGGTDEAAVPQLLSRCSSRPSLCLQRRCSMPERRHPPVE